MKNYLSWFLTASLLLIPSAQTASARSQKDKDAPSVDQIKVAVNKIGVGEKARATITQKNGTKTKGYVSKTGDDDFVIRDRKTSTPTTIRYADVAKVERHHGHSLARNVLIGVGIGAGAVLGAILIIIARAD